MHLWGWGRWGVARPMELEAESEAGETGEVGEEVEREERVCWGEGRA